MLFDLIEPLNTKRKASKSINKKNAVCIERDANCQCMTKTDSRHNCRGIKNKCFNLNGFGLLKIQTKFNGSNKSSSKI